MATIVRPATTADAEMTRSTLADLLPDHWRDGGHRRSFVAVREGVIVGHARGLDNDVHPGSRVVTWEVDESASSPDDDVLYELLSAVRDTSDRPPHVKVGASQLAVRAAVRRLGGVAIQAMPPWRYVAGELRGWSRQRRSAEVTAARFDDAAELLDFAVSHYVAQHATWSPADPTALTVEFRNDFAPGGLLPSSTILRRHKRIAAAALVWSESVDESDGHEVSLLTTRHNHPHSRVDLEECLAGVVDASTDDAVLLIDTHVTEPVERQIALDLPRHATHPTDEWTAIMSIPVTSARETSALTAALLPPDASWILDGSRPST